MEPVRKVLVVDDEQDSLEAVKSFLSGEGFDVSVASLWTEAIAQIQEASPDIVLLDLYMPTIQGDRLLGFIRELDADLPVVILSADAGTEKMEHLGDLGANGFVRKPFERDDLLMVVEQVLAERSLTVPEAAVASAEHAVEEPERPTSATLAAPVEVPASTLPSRITPGSGVEGIQPVRQIERPPPKVRRRVRRPKERLLKRFRTYILALILCVLIGIVLLAARSQFSGGFMGLGF